MADLNPYQQFALSAFMPLLFLAQLLLTALVQLVYQRVVKSQPFAIQPYSRTALALFLFSFVRVTSVCIRYLQCVRPLSSQPSVVFTAPAIVCYDAKYNAYLPLAVLVLFLYVIVGPALIVLMLKRNRQLIQHEDKEFSASCGSLFDVSSSFLRSIRSLWL